MTAYERMQLVKNLAAGLEYAGGHDGHEPDCAQCRDVRRAAALAEELAHEARLEDPEYALMRVTDYLAGEVAYAMKVSRAGCACALCARKRQHIYDLTDAAVIIMARRADMELERRRAAEVTGA